MSMTKTNELEQFLTKHSACSEAREWAKEFKTLHQAWNECQNPQWMLWALDAVEFKDNQTSRLFACWCVRNIPVNDGRKVWDLLIDERSRNAVEVAEKFANGEVDDIARSAAWSAARSAAWSAAWSAAEAAQANQLRKMIPWKTISKLVQNGEK